MKNIIKIIKDLESTTSTKAKEKIIANNSDNELFKKILIYTYDSDKKYGLTEKSLNDEKGVSKWNDLFDMLDELAKSNINNSLKSETNKYLNSLDADEKTLVKNILMKDLRVNISTKTINKAIPNLIVTHDIMLGSKWDGNLKEPAYVSIKLDGVRGSVIVRNGEVIIKTRQNKIIEGLNELTEAIKNVVPKDKDLFLDGELLSINGKNDIYLNSKELFKVTSAILNSKGEKREIRLMLFDAIPLVDYETKTSNIIFSERRKFIEELSSKDKTGLIECAKVFMKTDKVEDVYDKLNEVVHRGLEGLMINYDKPYEFKRSKNLLKVKQMYTMDLKIIGFEEGTGKYKNTLGAMIVEFKGNPVGVGSGLSDSTRSYIWNNQKDLIGKIAEIQYFEITKDKDGNESLRYPVFIGMRYDKDTESYE